MKKMKKSVRNIQKWFVLSFAMLALVLAQAGSVMAAGVTVNGGTSSNNAHKHEYEWNWATQPESFLFSKGDGFCRVEGIGDYVYIEEYSSDFELTSTSRVEMELPLFGGAYAGASNYFLVFGAENTYEEDEFEVMRVVKYDKSWNRIAETCYEGCNTFLPFEAGSLDMTEYAGILYIRTCHEMYMDQNGVNHQANMTFAINEETMAKVSDFTRVLNVSYGYVSHSFNQFIKVVNGKLVAVDHGDANPRAIVLGQYPYDASTGNVVPGYYNPYSYVKLLTIPGTSGDNYTGVNVGGFEASSTHYLVAINSVDLTNMDSSYAKSVKLLVQPIDNFNTSSTVVRTIATYEDGGSFSAGNPYLIPLGNDEFAVMWEEVRCPSKIGVTTGFLNRIKLAVVDKEGNRVGQIQTISGSLSDCAPIYQNGKIVWYVTSGGAPTFYSVHVSTPAHTLTHVEEVAPTCCSEGSAEYWICSGCQRMFSDSQGVNEIDAPEVLAVDKDAHVWGEWAITKEASLTEEGELTRICELDQTHQEHQAIAKLVALTGTVRISGDVKYGETLVVNVLDSNCSGELSYQWTRDGKPISNAVNSSYEVVAEDIGSFIGCIVTSDVEGGEIFGETSGAVEKADGPAAPEGITSESPSKKGASDGKIFGVTEGYEYAANPEFENAVACTGEEITGLAAGTYYIRVAETNVTKAGAYAAIVVEEGAAVVDTSAPRLEGALAGKESITVSWIANELVPQYAVFRKTNGGKWTKLDAVTGTNDGAVANAGDVCSYIDQTAAAGTVYFYTVRGMNLQGKYITGYDTTGVSAEIESTQEPLDKSSPVLKDAVASENGISVSWYANSGVQKYTIFRKVSGGKWTKLAETTGTADGGKAEAGSECSYFDGTALVNVTYIYAVRGVDENGKYVTSYDATGVSATMAGQQEVLDKSSPVLKDAVASENGITVSWYANSGVQKYTIFRKVSGGKWTKLAETTGTADGGKAEAGSECSYFDGTALVGVTYIYAVRGVDENGKYVTSYDANGISATMH